MIYVAAVLLVMLAILFSVARVILQDLGKYREVVEQQVSQLLNQKVRIQGFDARLEGITPVLIFKDVELLNSKTNKELARFSEARIGLAVLASIRELHIVPGEITINGIHIMLTRHKNGSLSIQGLKVSQAGGIEQTSSDNQLAQWLFTYSDLSLENSSIVWQDRLRGKRYQFNDVNVHLTNSGRRHILSGQMEVPKALGRDVKFSADIDGDTLNPEDWQGTFYAQAYSVNIRQWEQFRPQWNNARLKSGQLDVRLWGAWRHNRLASLSADLSAYDLLLEGKNAAPIKLKLLAGMFAWQRGEQGWSIKIKDFQLIHQGGVWPKTDMAVFYKTGKQDSYQVNADYLRIEDIHSIANALALGPVKLRQGLNGLHPSGDIQGLSAKVFIKNHKMHNFVVRAAFSHIHTTAWQHYPAVQGFQGTVVSTLNYGELKIDNNFSTLYFPKLFRRAFSLHELKTRLAWRRGDDGWMLSANNIVARTAAIKANAGIYLHLPANKASPYLDLQVQFWDGDASKAATYYPVGIMGKELVHWLDQGIVAGKVSFGGAVFSGRLHDFPFRQQQGTFQVRFYADNVELNYQHNWPHLTNARIDASFNGEGMHIKGLQAQLLKQTTSQQVEVDIKDFLQPELRVQAKTRGPTRELFEFLVDSPIAPDARDFVKSIDMHGESKLDVNLYVPLSDRMAAISPLHYRGDVDLHNTSFALLGKAVDIRGVKGRLRFDERGLSAKAIQAAIMGEPAILDVYTQDFKHARPVQIVAKGRLNAALLKSRFTIPGLDKLSGTSRWQGVFTLPYRQSDRRMPARLSISSDLQGVNIGLPAPLNKKAGTKTAFAMTVAFPRSDITQMTFHYSDQLQVALGLKTQGDKVEISKGAVNFGKAIPGLPRRNILRLEGTTPELSVNDWLAVFSGKEKTGKQSRHDWREMPIELAMNGLQLHFKMDDKKTAAPTKVNILPQQWPLMNGYINNLVINKTKIGKLKMVVDREPNGFKIKRLNLSTPFSKITSSGGWYYHKQQETSLNIDMKSTDLGAQLSQWGFAAIIKAGKVKNTHAQVRWAGSPFDFNFKKLNGSLNVHIEKGNIVEVDPGAGRLFGLLSLSALPRRLFLDFTDMNSGFSFDTLQARFNIGGGNATTKNLSVDSTLAKVVVDGRTGLSQQDYDLNVLVIPNVSGTAPLPGYLVWGPQVGAVLLFFKQIFGSAFDKSIARAYHITGSWEKPVIKKVDSDSGKKK